MSKVLGHFESLAKFPHCSGKTEELRAFLTDFAKEQGYQVNLDEANNILIVKGKPVLALQAHYDMVCMGKAPALETYEEGGWLKAKGSSLGADNGIAIAMMMALMEEGHALEFLLTSDEEIGLIGANAIGFPLQSRYMLNLDSETEGEVYIGCAGGVDIKAAKKFTAVSNDHDCFEVSISNLPGGHSGIDIDKGIPNAIVELSKVLGRNQARLITISGGERINSIPAAAKAVVASEIEFAIKDDFAVKKIEKLPLVIEDDILSLISDFPNGVVKFNDALGIPQVSQNLAIVTTHDDAIEIEVSIRGMSRDELHTQAEVTADYFREAGFEVEKKDKYPAWSPQENEFTKIVQEVMHQELGNSALKAIHAGLECGVLKQKYPHILFASIGPTIIFPHSIREAVSLDSVARTFEVLQKIVDRVAQIRCP
jgi:dipeptidase D